MTILDKQSPDQTGLRAFGHLDGDELVIHYGNPEGNGMQMPNGQTEIRLSVQAIRDLVRAADVAAQETLSTTQQVQVPETMNVVAEQVVPNPGLGPTG